MKLYKIVTFFGILTLPLLSLGQNGNKKPVTKKNSTEKTIADSSNKKTGSGSKEEKKQYAGVDFNNYHPILSSGKLPPDLTTLSSEKYKKSKEEYLKQEDSRKVKKAKDKFLLESSYKIDEMLQGGRVLYNDPIGNYVKEVAKVLLNDDKETYSKLRIYIIKSSVVNAYTTNSGIIFINTGLIAQLENEAQLAFILAHEIIHYKKQHIMEEVVENVRISSGKNKYRYIQDDEDAFIASLQFSKEKEMEADQLGYELFAKSPYASKYIASVFDVLEYSYLPFDEVAFDWNLLQSETYQFPAKYILSDTAVKPISGEDVEEENDKYSTHPNIQTRRDALEAKINEDPGEGQSAFYQGEEAFKYIRKICRFEVFRALLLAKAYPKAFYTGYLILKEEEPNSIYIHRGMAKALCDLAMYSIYNDDDFEEDQPLKYTNVEGLSQPLYKLFSNLYTHPTEMGVLALRFIALQLIKHPNDPFLMACKNQLVDVLKSEKRIYPSRFKYRIVKIDSTRINEPEKEKTESKYDKIKKKKTETESKEPTKQSYFYSAFIDVVTLDSTFETWLKKQFVYIKSKDNKEEDESESDEQTTYHHENVDELSCLGIDKTIILDPFYLIAGSNDQIKLQASEEATFKIVEYLSQTANAAGVENEFVLTGNMSESDLLLFNKSAIFNDYLRELNYTPKTQTIPVDFLQIDSMVKVSGSSTLIVSGIVQVRDNNQRRNTDIGFYSAMFVWSGIPYYISKIFFQKLNFSNYLYFMVIDVKRNKLLGSELIYSRGKVNNDQIKAHLYDFFLTIKQPKKTDSDQ